MRTKLQKIENMRDIFYGTFEKRSTKNGYKGIVETILLKDITDASNNILTDHLWFNLTKGFEKVDLKPGDKIKFKARVKEYEKGYKGYRDDVYKPIESDYKLSYPSKIEKVIN